MIWLHLGILPFNRVVPIVNLVNFSYFSSLRRITSLWIFSFFDDCLLTKWLPNNDDYQRVNLYWQGRTKSRMASERLWYPFSAIKPSNCSNKFFGMETPNRMISSSIFFRVTCCLKRSTKKKHFKHYMQFLKKVRHLNNLPSRSFIYWLKKKQTTFEKNLLALNESFFY